MAGTKGVALGGVAALLVAAGVVVGAGWATRPPAAIARP